MPAPKYHLITEVLQMRDASHTPHQIAIRFGLALSTVLAYLRGKQPKINLVNNPAGSQKITHEPTPEDIGRECEKIQATWTPEERVRRGGSVSCMWLPPGAERAPPVPWVYRQRPGKGTIKGTIETIDETGTDE